MKTILTFFVLGLFTLAHVTGFMQKENPPLIAFDSLVYHFEPVKAGTILSHDFKFTNKGEAALKISNVTAKCNCVKVTWTKEAVPAEGNGKISVTYNTAGKTNGQDETLTVSSNSDGGKIILHIQGDVFANPKAKDSTGRY